MKPHQQLQLPKTKQIRSTNFTSTSETIARGIIDKLISLTLTQHTLHLIEEQIGDHCFSSIQSLLSSYLSMNYIPYDKDEIMDQPSILLDQSTISKKGNEDTTKYEGNYIPITMNYYDNFIEGENSWSEISMPSSTWIDRTASNFNQTVKPEKDNNNPHMKKIVVNNSNQIIEEVSISEDKSIQIQSTPNKPKPRQRIVQREIINEKVKPKRVQATEFTSYDLPKDSSRTNDQKEIEDLRFEKLNELKTSEKAREELIKKAKEKLDTEQKALNKQKELDKKTITLDAKGNIIEVKKVALEKLIPEFIPIISEQKNLHIINNNNNNNNAKEDNAQNKIDNNSSGGIKNILTKGTLKTKTNQVPQLFQNVSKAVLPQGQLPQSQLQPQSLPQQPLQPQSLAHKYQEQEKRQEGLLPAGSNFDLMKLEIGVELHEEAKYKTGGKDFYRKYQRYSVNNFKEQNETYKSSFTNQKDIMPRIETKSNSNELSSGISELEERRKSSLNNNRNSLNNNAPSRSNPFPQKDSIQLNTKNSIKNAFDKLDLIYEKEEDLKGHFGKEYNTNTHFFKQGGKIMVTQRVNTAKPKRFDEMMNFNSTLMNNKNWGAEEAKKKINHQMKRYPVKPQLKTIEQEIGMNIIKTKLPRARCFSYIKSPLKQNSNSNSNNNTNDHKTIGRTSSAGLFKVVNKNNSEQRPRKVFSQTASDKFLAIQPRF